MSRTQCRAISVLTLKMYPEKALTLLSKIFLTTFVTNYFFVIKLSFFFVADMQSHTRALR